jgi:hypothetical protein
VCTAYACNVTRHVSASAEGDAAAQDPVARVRQLLADSEGSAGDGLSCDAMDSDNAASEVDADRTNVVSYDDEVWPPSPCLAAVVSLMVQWLYRGKYVVHTVA